MRIRTVTVGFIKNNTKRPKPAYEKRKKYRLVIAAWAVAALDTMHAKGTVAMPSFCLAKFQPVVNTSVIPYNGTYSS
jgi:hypothetical protein